MLFEMKLFLPENEKISQLSTATCIERFCAQEHWYFRKLNDNWHIIHLFSYIWKTSSLFSSIYGLDIQFQIILCVYLSKQSFCSLGDFLVMNVIISTKYQLYCWQHFFKFFTSLLVFSRIVFVIKIY